ncbi:MAG: hypothetical protein KDD49_07510, partial [Bacteroidetes bacterium]|nr:hypothetical protein [Bacteroidota bacterium]
MQDEKIIRDEAKQFYNKHVKIDIFAEETIKQFHKLKSRLYDFYSDEFKSIFLDEIQNCIKTEL